MLLLSLILGAADPAILDLSKALEDADVWTDDQGHNVVTAGSDTFYGDGKVFYKMRRHWSQGANYVDERYPRIVTSFTQVDDSTASVTCGERQTELHKVPDPTAKALLAKAVFKRPRLDVKPYVLGRDDHGIYYYVDHGAFADNQDVYHVYIGPRGDLKPARLKNVVHDAAGDVFATPNGDLRLVANPQKRTEWIAGAHHETLTDVPIDDSWQLIFNDLGVYKRLRLGTVCDDL